MHRNLVVAHIYVIISVFFDFTWCKNAVGGCREGKSITGVGFQGSLHSHLLSHKQIHTPAIT